MKERLSHSSSHEISQLATSDSRWRVPLFEPDVDDEEVDAVARVLRSKWLTMGPGVKKFETLFASHLGAKHAVAVSSGTAALHLAHQALGLGSGDEVICPSLTFVATANSILYTGAKPRFADIASLDELNISPEEIGKRINRATRCITVVHYAGVPCRMDEIMAIAMKHGLAVVEDVAHAPGAEYNGRKCGTISNIGCFSFFSNKNLSVGEGGMVVTNDDVLAERIRRNRSHGLTASTWEKRLGNGREYDAMDVGFNYRLDEIRAAMGIVQLSKLSKNNDRREKLAKLYRIKLREVEGVSVPFSAPLGRSSHHIFPVILGEGVDRSSVMRRLAERGIETSIHYPPIHLFTVYMKKCPRNEGLPITEEAGRKEVTLPLFPTMTEADVDYVAQNVMSCINENC